MSKLSKSALALLLAGTMAFMPAADILAADNTDTINLTVMETEDTTQESDATETETNTAGTETDADSAEGGDSKGTDLNGDNNDASDSDLTTDNETNDNNNADSETGDNKDNNVTDSDSENGNASDSENNGSSDSDADADLEDDNDDVQDSDTESDSEADDLNSEDDETDSEQIADNGTEEEFPGLINSALSAKQLSDKRDLADHLDEIASGVEGTDYVNRELIFAASTLAEAEKIAAAYGATLKDFDEGIGVLTLPENISVSHALTVAATSKDVILPPAWPNYIYKAYNETDENTNSDTAVSDEVYLNDNAYTEAVKAYSDPFLSPTDSNYQYQHAMVGSTYAWNAGYTGNGIKIAILDSGVNNHADLNVVYNYNSASSSSTDAADQNGHGTHVAGLAAAKSNSIGGAGIAPGAAIYNIRVLDSKGIGSDDAIIRGIRHAIGQNVDIINMSLGGPGYNPLCDTAINEAYNAGIVVFAAAGNDGSKVKCYPACYPKAICVGAVAENRGRTYFSNYGSWINFSAPGMSLASTSKSGGYEKMSGTSQATPVVSGTAAVILSADKSIRDKTGKAKVDALISKMNKGKISGSGGAAGIVSLAKALDIPVSTAAPKAPVFVQTDKTVNGDSLSVSIKAASTSDKIYYNKDGKNPTYKNGVLSDATEYTGAFTIGGSAKVTVKAIAVNACGQASKAASITYTFKPLVSNITITGQSGLLKGKSTTLKAVVEPSYAANKKVNWSVSPANKGVTVSTSGKVTATSSAEDNTTYTITATSADSATATEGEQTKGTFEIKVKSAAKVKSVAFKNSETKKAQKNAVISEANPDYNLAPLLEVTNLDGTSGSVNDVDFSSSNTQIAAIDSTTRGNIKIKGVGKAVITATANDGSGKKATFTLTVQKPVTKLEISGSSKLAIGKSTKLTVTVNKDAANKKLDWSVSPADKGVTVSNGTVKASKTATPGSYTVTATAKDGSGKTASKEITVSDVKVTKITLVKKSETEPTAMKSGTIFRVSGNYPSKTKTAVTIAANITGGTGSDIEFTSSNPGIATVSQNGNEAIITATGKLTGTTKITCKSANGKSASCTIKVVNPPSHLAIASPAGFSEFVAIGKKMKLSAVFEEEFGAVSSKNVTWKSSDETKATVDKSGNVKGVSVGTAVITATANDGSGLSAQYEIRISNPVKTLALYSFRGNGTLIKWINVLKLNKPYEIPVLYNGNVYTGPSICPDVAIEIGNPDIMSVQYDSAGCYIIYGLKRGSTTITVKALDGTGTKVTYNARVE